MWVSGQGNLETKVSLSQFYDEYEGANEITEQGCGYLTKASWAGSLETLFLGIYIFKCSNKPLSYN